MLALLANYEHDSLVGQYVILSSEEVIIKKSS